MNAIPVIGGVGYGSSGKWSIGDGRRSVLRKHEEVKRMNVLMQE